MMSIFLTNNMLHVAVFFSFCVCVREDNRKKIKTNKVEGKRSREEEKIKKMNEAVLLIFNKKQPNRNTVIFFYEGHTHAFYSAPLIPFEFYYFQGTMWVGYQGSGPSSLFFD